MQRLNQQDDKQQNNSSIVQPSIPDAERTPSRLFFLQQPSPIRGSVLRTSPNSAFAPIQQRPMVRREAPNAPQKQQSDNNYAVRAENVRRELFPFAAAPATTIQHQQYYYPPPPCCP